MLSKNDAGMPESGQQSPFRIPRPSPRGTVSKCGKSPLPEPLWRPCFTLKPLGRDRTQPASLIVEDPARACQAARGSAASISRRVAFFIHVRMVRRRSASSLERPESSSPDVNTRDTSHEQRAHTVAHLAQNTYLSHRIIPSRVAARRLHNRNFENALTRCRITRSAPAPD